MSWLQSLGTIGGFALGGPMGAAIGGGLGGGLDSERQRKDINAYNEGQREAGRYSSYTGQKPKFNYSQPNAVSGALGGAAQGYMGGKSFQQAGLTPWSQMASNGSAPQGSNIVAMNTATPNNNQMMVPNRQDPFSWQSMQMGNNQMFNNPMAMG